LAALVAAVVLLCAATGALQWLGNQVYDAAIRTATPAPLAEITLVGADDASLRALGPAPWSPQVYARLIDQLSAAGAKGIVITSSLPRPSSNEGLAYVRRIREALARQGDAPPSAELAGLIAEAESALG